MNSKANASADNAAPRRRRRNASDLAMIIIAMVTGGMLSYILTSFAVVPAALVIPSIIGFTDSR